MFYEAVGMFVTITLGVGGAFFALYKGIPIAFWPFSRGASFAPTPEKKPESGLAAPAVSREPPKRAPRTFVIPAEHAAHICKLRDAKIRAHAEDKSLAEAEQKYMFALKEIGFDGFGHGQWNFVSGDSSTFPLPHLKEIV